MEILDTNLSGCRLIRLQPRGDERGFFVRTFCTRTFEAAGMNPALAQASYSFSKRRGTVRGLHFQAHPAMEDKLVRCVRGAIFDVMVDVRPGSPTFGRWLGYELSESNHLQIFAPRGFAHGFQTLSDDCVVAYQIAQHFEPELTAGVVWNDPDIGVAWPLSPRDQSARDLALPLLKDIPHERLNSWEAK